MYTDKEFYVSVPIRGLFNLTRGEKIIVEYDPVEFPSPSGDYLI